MQKSAVKVVVAVMPIEVHKQPPLLILVFRHVWRNKRNNSDKYSGKRVEVIAVESEAVEIVVLQWYMSIDHTIM